MIAASNSLPGGGGGKSSLPSPAQKSPKTPSASSTTKSPKPTLSTALNAVGAVLASPGLLLGGVNKSPRPFNKSPKAKRPPTTPKKSPATTTPSKMQNRKKLSDVVAAIVAGRDVDDDDDDDPNGTEQELMMPRTLLTDKDVHQITKLMGEVIPNRLWVGSVRSVEYVDRVYQYNDVLLQRRQQQAAAAGGGGGSSSGNNSNNYRCDWTIISLLNPRMMFDRESNQIHKVVDRQLARLKKKRDDTGGARVVKHVTWGLEDDMSSDFLCDRLEQVLAVMEDAIEQRNDDGGGSSSDGDGENPKNRPPSSSVLVHCEYGKSRSVALCAAYLISRRKYTLRRAMDAIHMNRPTANPNVGFLASLRALENCRGDVKAARKQMNRA